MGWEWVNPSVPCMSPARACSHRAVRRAAHSGEARTTETPAPRSPEVPSKPSNAYAAYATKARDTRRVTILRRRDVREVGGGEVEILIVPPPNATRASGCGGRGCVRFKSLAQETRENIKYIVTSDVGRSSWRAEKRCAGRVGGCETKRLQRNGADEKKVLAWQG